MKGKLGIFALKRARMFDSVKTMDTVSKDILDNTVPATDQLGENPHVCFFGDEDADFKVIFIGNSITRHRPKADIGWYRDCGMAASSLANDYVHICLNELRKIHGKVQACIAQCSPWECEFWSDTLLEEKFSLGRDFKANLVIVRIGENTKREALSEHSYKEAFDKMVKFFACAPNVKVVTTGMFWRDDRLERDMKEVAIENGYEYVNIVDLGELDEMKAIGLFEHYGVSIHPGDLGMKCIAERIMEAVNK